LQTEYLRQFHRFVADQCVRLKIKVPDLGILTYRIDGSATNENKCDEVFGFKSPQTCKVILRRAKVLAENFDITFLAANHIMLNNILEFSTSKVKINRKMSGSLNFD